MTSWKKVQGTQSKKPAEWDTTSSSYFVYQRKNIQRVTATDETTGEAYEYWEYDERKFTKEEYHLMREKELEDELTQTQIALAEMYESTVI